MSLNYNGDVFKCGVSHFEPCDRVGRIDPGGRLVRDEKAWGRFVSTDLFEPVCEECVYLPLCMGGCRAARLKAGETGSFCTLIPTNTAYVLQQVAYGGFGAVASQACAEAEKSLQSALTDSLDDSEIQRKEVILG
jgi:radical SAM protein with 4Fe4S-binding SPASM domain